MAGRNVGAGAVVVVVAVGLALGGSGSARAYDPQPVVGGAATAIGTVDASADQAEEQPEMENVIGEVSEEYEGDFCGGGESPVDEAWGVMRDGDPRKAERMVRRGLRDGSIERWAQAGAYALLGEIALDGGRTRAAISAYRRALRIDAEEAGLGSRVGLAIALLRAGNRPAAAAEAEHAAAECRDDAYADRVACYGAYHVIGLASDDANAMLEAMQAELVIESTETDGNAEELAQLRERAQAPARRPRTAHERNTIAMSE